MSHINESIISSGCAKTELGLPSKRTKSAGENVLYTLFLIPECPIVQDLS